jgi:uncharacterized protein YcfL
MRLRTGAAVILAGLLLSGCSGTNETPVPDRPEKPIEATVTIKVPGMT